MEDTTQPLAYCQQLIFLIKL